MRRRLRTIARCSTVACFIACSGSDADADWAGTIETLPNGAVRVTNPASGLWATESAWQLRQELVLGDEDGELPSSKGML
jgi:hypothetical protein